MEILFAGDLARGTRSLQRLEALRSLGHRVRAVQLDPIALYGRSWSLLRAGFSNLRLLWALKSKGTELFWVEKGLLLHPDLLLDARRRHPGICLACYSEDDMFAAHNRNSLYLRDLPLYDVVFTTKSYNAEPGELPSLGARKVVFIDKAFHATLHRPVEPGQEEKRRYGADVGFIGSFEAERAEAMLCLAESGVRVRIWGNGWGPWRGRHPLLAVENRPIYSGEYVLALCATKINLCFLRKINRDQQTDRSVEIPACGAFMLAERTEEHQRLFTEDREAVYFSDTLEMFAKVRYYLEHEAERERIAAAGRCRCLEGGYDHGSRLRVMLTHCGAGGGA
ncbi:MAG: glycosyltransferase [Planctomycetes bacterium]|nr:glycosyltransferase [Planctomycetota bacterium]